MIGKIDTMMIMIMIMIITKGMIIETPCPHEKHHTGKIKASAPAPPLREEEDGDEEFSNLMEEALFSEYAK